jgi:hypothetical protein
MKFIDSNLIASVSRGNGWIRSKSIRKSGYSKPKIPYTYVSHNPPYRSGKYAAAIVASIAIIVSLPMIIGTVLRIYL